MKIKDIILEGPKEDKIALNQGKKLIAAYQAKDSKFATPFSTANELVDYLSANTNPAYIQWVVTNYINDNELVLEDLPTLRDLLNEYDVKKKIKNLGLASDISAYKFASLRDALSAIRNTPHHVNKLMSVYYDTMKHQVEIGNGEWKFQGGNVNIYSPLNYEGSTALRKCAPNDISLCVTFLDDRSHYDNYTSIGVLDFVLTPKELYLAYFSGNPAEHPSEYADRANKHDGMNFILAPIFNKHLPDEIYSVAEYPEKEPINIPFLQVSEKEEYKLYAKFVKLDPSNIKDVDPSIPEYAELAINAVSRFGSLIKLIDPKTPRYSDIAIAAVSSERYTNPRPIVHVDPKTPKYFDIAKASVTANESSIRDIKPDTPGYDKLVEIAIANSPRIVFELPAEYQTYDRYLVAINQSKESIYAVSGLKHEGDQFEEIALAIITKFPNALLQVRNEYRTLKMYELVARIAPSIMFEIMNNVWWEKPSWWTHVISNKLLLTAIDSGKRLDFIHNFLRKLNDDLTTKTLQYSISIYPYILGMIPLQRPDYSQLAPQPVNAEVDRVKELAERLLR